jgi:hypothetical protein
MNMTKKTLTSAIVAILGWQGQAVAETTIEDRVTNTERRIKYMEQRLQDQEKVLREQGHPTFVWGGVLEVEAAYSDPYVGDSTSDVVLATAELGVGAQINAWVSGEITLLYEEDDTDLEVDVATVTVAPPEGAWSVTAGQLYVPFGSFETNLVSDPLTLEIGETRESAVQASIESSGLAGTFYVFNGSNKKDAGADDLVDNWGAALGYGHEADGFSLSAGLGYINDIGDSDAIQDSLTSNSVQDHVPGWTAGAMIETGPFVVIGEYVAATEAFQATELDFNGRGAEPKAWNIEAGYNFELAGKGATFAVGYQGTDEALALELPEERILAALSVDVLDNTTLSFEVANDKDYYVADGGTGESANTATAQLAVAF